MISSVIYGWHQARFLEMAKNMYDADGSEVLKNLWEFPGKYQTRLSDEEFISQLEKKVHPSFKTFALTPYFLTTKKIKMTNRKITRVSRPKLEAEPRIGKKRPTPAASLLVTNKLRSIADNIYKKPMYNKVPAVGFGIVINGKIYTHVDGVRKYGTRMSIQKDDMFALGSIGKPLTGYLFATYAQKVAKFRNKGFYASVNDIYPEFIKHFENNFKKGVGADHFKHYSNITIGQMMAHVSGLDYMPQHNNYPKDHEDLLRQIKSTNSLIDFTPADLIEKRKFYSQIALSDPPFGGWELRPKNNNNIKMLENTNGNLSGTCTLYKYSGGCIVVASMMEKVSKKSWEQLVVSYVFNPLNISNYRFLGTSKNNSLGLPAGTHQHFIRNKKVESFDILPGDISQMGHTHRPAGVPAMSMDDFGKWIRAVIDLYNTRGIGPDSIKQIKNDYFNLLPTSGFTMGGWGSSNGVRLSHDGSNGYNYSRAVLQVDKSYGFYVFANIDTSESRALINEMSRELDNLCKTLI